MADVLSYNDYYPFGWALPNRSASSSNYRYGFQGQEKDDEIKGEGLSVNYKYRMQDPRVGRFFAIDPLFRSYPHNSPYVFSENEVINSVELEGLEQAYVYNVWQDGQGQTLKRLSHVYIDKKVDFDVRVYRYFGPTGNIERTYTQLIASSIEGSEYTQITDVKKPVPQPKGVNEICVTNCHTTRLGERDVDLGGLVRDVSNNYSSGLTFIDSATDVMKKGSVFGKYSPHLSIGLAINSVLGDYYSESNAPEFTNNTIKTATTTAIGIKNPMLAIAVGIQMDDASDPDGITNLSNGRMASSFSVQQTQTQSYLNKNFINRNQGATGNIDMETGNNKLDMVIWYAITLQWKKINDLTSQGKNQNKTESPDNE